MRGPPDPEDNHEGTALHHGVPDCHDTVTGGADGQPEHVYNEHVDILEVRVVHDGDSLYTYIRTKGDIAQSAVANDTAGTTEGRFYVIVTIDVDGDEATGFRACASAMK